MSRGGNVPQFSDNAVIFNDKKKKKYKFLSLAGILHISAKLQRYLQNVILTNRSI